MKYKLGKLPVKYDERTLQFSSFLNNTILPYIPQTSHWPNAAPLGMLMNDSIGDCTVAASLHMERLWSKANNQIFSPTDEQALAAYSAITGYTPSNPASDTGAFVLDVLNYWRKTGIGGRKIGAFVQINPHNHSHVMAASFLFGGLLIGINLPACADNQFWNNPPVWDVPVAGLTGPGAPGSAGGHCVSIAGYSSHGLDTVTWGARILQTWKFWDAYVDECYAIISTDFITNPLKAPNGFDMISLQKFLALVTN